MKHKPRFYVMAQVCEIVERMGSTGSGPVSKELGMNVGVYCARAVEHGMMRVDLSERPRQYSVVPGWRGRLEDLGKHRLVERRDREPRRFYDAAPLALVWGACVAAGTP